ncbi:MAG: NigD-like C-terminal domain-containing protein [Bacteroidota bacterium]|nr:NigD-like C-terminal domain-containing protein [Bacteroidota bacterium]
MNTKFFKTGFMIMVVGLLLTTSCLKELNDNNRYWISYGLVIGTTGNLNIRLDDGTILYADASSQNLLSQYASDRVLVNYNVVSNKVENGVTNYNVKINSIDKLLMKSVVLLTKQNADSLGNDPINARGFWFGNNLLNVNFSFLQNTKTHLINLAKDTIQSDPTTVSLLLKHNAFGDGTVYERSGFVSFDLSSLLNGKDSVNIDVKYTDYFGTSHDFKGTYKPLK